MSLGGPYRYTREGRGVFHMPLARPWTWALTHHGLRCLFVSETEPARMGVPERRYPQHPSESLLGCWIAIYATREYDEDATRWMHQATGLVPPAKDALPGGCYVAVGRLAEVTTLGNDLARAVREPWWWGAAPCRGTVAWWLEDVVVLEPLPAADGQRLAPIDEELLPELRERMRLAMDGLWRPEQYAVPAAPPVLQVEAPVEPRKPEAPPRVELPADDSPVAPLAENPEQLGLFMAAPRPPPVVTVQDLAEAATEASDAEPPIPSIPPVAEERDELPPVFSETVPEQISLFDAPPAPKAVGG